jgi:hypothetical protein
MSLKDFARRSEIISKENIKKCYRDIDMLYYELDFLNNLLSRYSNKTAGTSFSIYERQNEMASIREQIPRVYKDINFYKECINVEKMEMKRIRETYGYNDERNYNNVYDQEHRQNYTYNEDYDDYNDNYNDDYNDNDSESNEYENNENNENNEIDDELEEIKDYKYNPVTDTFE